MPTAKRLPSGAFRVRIYSHTDSSGKKVYKSFTAPTKTKAEQMANEFKSGKKSGHEDITVKEAVKKYIQSNENTLSPSTLRGYGYDLKRMEPIHHLKINKLRSYDVQNFISKLALKYSTKSIKNTYGLLCASVTHFSPDIHFRVNLPKEKKKRLCAPSEHDIEVLLNAAGPKMKICIALAAFHSFRRGEISALTYGDLKGNRIHVHADVILNSSGEWIYKEYPKTEDSDRFATLPEPLVKLIGKGDNNDYIVGWVPGSITNRFQELCRKNNINMRFHDLRHYFASVGGGVLQIPTFYLAQMGGWENTGTTMKKVYENNIVSMEEFYSNKMNDYFQKFYNV